MTASRERVGTDVLYDTCQARMTEMRVAAALLTRLPLRPLPAAAYENSARAAWAYPLAGLAVSLLAGLAASLLLFWGCGPAISAGFYLMVVALLTGALHEDGLADCADGFWGGATPARRLEIMKDSHIGSYGTLALILVIGLRWSACAALLPLGIAPLLSASVLSRAMMPLLMRWLANARPSGLSQRTGRPRMSVAIAGVAIGVAVSVVLTGTAGVAAALAALAITLAIARLAVAKIRGQTGDVLGACQQLAEVGALICFVALT
ncbi:adenosylcobinamide-GDP ribazoletransferase [Sulfitobacter sp. LCG007]